MDLEGTNLWSCSECATQGIAAGLTSCPNCRKEREMPAVNAAGHSTVYGFPNTAQLAAQGVGLSPPNPPADEEETGTESIDQVSSEAEVVSETDQATDPIALATEKASLAKEAFSSGDKATATSLLDEAISLDSSRADKWTKLKDQVVGSGEQW